jgi:hypothetical protein
MAIVAVGEASEDAWLDDDPQSEWFNHHFVEIHGLRMLPEPVTRAQMLEECEGWGWPKMPGVGVRVPDTYLPILEGMLSV